MKKVLIAASMLLAASTGARADVVTIDSIVDGWVESSVVGGGSTVNIANVVNPGTDRIRWGTGSPQSGYDWDSTDTSFNVNTGSVFSLGTFTHLNNPIGAGTSITAVDLSFSVGTFTNPANLNATFNFAHDETPNSGTCEYPSTPGNPCADQVTISDVPFNEQIEYNGNIYFFSLLGFSTNGGNTISNTFVSQEGGNNSAQLYAVITDSRVPDGGTTLALLGGALMGLGVIRRRFGR